MPWRRRPRAAFVILLSAGALLAVAAGLRAPDLPPAPTIDSTLTRDSAGCAAASTAWWHPLSGLDYTGRLHFTLPSQFGGAIALYVGDAVPLDVEASDVRGDPVPMNLERLIVGPGVLVPPDFWIENGTPLEAPRHLSRLMIDAWGEGERSVIVSLGRRAPRVLARLVGYPERVRVPICAVPFGEDEIYFATGWYGQERQSAEGPVRWMREHGAVLVWSRDGKDARIRVRLAPAVAGDAGEPIHLRVRVNDVHDLPPVALAPAFGDYELMVPDRAWVPGANELFFTVSRSQRLGPRVRGLALASLHVE